jgi:excisionase family DNA binding protein
MTLEPTPERITVRIKEACRITGIGRSKLYELIAEGKINVVKVGAMTLIPVDSLKALTDGRRQRR